ncbi:hypothetical protein CHUAL_009947 [Chamberlinius hualienensis]
MIKLILTLSVTLAVTSSMTASEEGPICCTVETSGQCDWVTNSWHDSSSLKPNVAAYPGFSWGSNYIWLQDISGTTQTAQTVTIDSKNTVFNFDYYYNVDSSYLGSYLDVFLVTGIFPSQEILLKSITTSADAWLHIDVLCGSSESNFCCGSPSSFPCSGTIKIVGSLNLAPTQGLMAIDNIGICGDSDITTTSSVTTTTTTPTTTTTEPTTTTTEPTTAPTTSTTQIYTTASTTSTQATSTTTSPIQPVCCDFEFDTCMWELNGWHWSNASQPPPPLPGTNTGNYVWATDSGSSMQFEVSNVLESTLFTLDYYINTTSGNDNVIAAFQEIGTTNVNIQVSMSNTANQWKTISTDCSPKAQYESPGCCISYPCAVKIMLQVTAVTESAVFAVDDTGINMYCGDSSLCCQFRDETGCHFENNQWSWNGDSEPDTTLMPDFVPTSDYLWYQSYSDGAKISAKALSPLINIQTEKNIIAKIYAFTDSSQNDNWLEITFYDPSTNVTTLLDFVIDTTNSWHTFTLSCSSSHGNCCGEASYCSGYLEFTANVVHGSAFYALDALSTSSTNMCPM